MQKHMHRDRDVADDEWAMPYDVVRDVVDDVVHDAI